MVNNMNLEQLKEKIGSLIDTSLNEPILNNISNLEYNEEKDVVSMTIKLGAIQNSNEAYIRREIAKIVKLEEGHNGVKIKFEEFRKSLKVAGPNTKFLLVSGGKGGVGKSFVTANLAYALTKIGKKVGIIDADIYGATIPNMYTMLNEGISVGEGNKINPFKKFGVEVISTDFFSEYEKPICWQGNTLFTMINNFLYQVNWDKELDYILIDMPSGTGDVLLTLGKELKDGKVLIVSEEDMLSARMALKTANAHKDVGQSILGIVINKQGDDNFAETYLTEKLDVPCLMTIPYERPSERSFLYEENDKNASTFEDLATIISSIL